MEKENKTMRIVGYVLGLAFVAVGIYAFFAFGDSGYVFLGLCSLLGLFSIFATEYLKKIFEAVESRSHIQTKDDDSEVDQGL